MPPNEPLDQEKTMDPKERYAQLEETLDAILHRQAHGPLYNGRSGEKTDKEFFQVAEVTKFLLTRVKEQDEHLSLLMLTVHMLLGTALEDLLQENTERREQETGGETWQEV